MYIISFSFTLTSDRVNFKSFFYSLFICLYYFFNNFSYICCITCIPHINYFNSPIVLLLFIVYRLEEKEQELKKEYSILHERYTELLKTHMEYIERTKIMMGSVGSDRMDSRPPRLPSMGIGHINS